MVTPTEIEIVLTALGQQAVVLAGTKILGAVVEKLRDREDLAWARGSSQIDVEILTRAAWQARQHDVAIDALTDEVRGMQARMIEHLRDPAHDRLRGNFVLEATREVLDERYNMIVSAAVEEMLSDESIGEKARVERTLRELDPRDVRELAALAALTLGPEFRRADAETEEKAIARERQNALRRSPCWHELIAAGVVATEVTGGFADAPRAYITPRGRQVLRALATWLRMDATTRPPEPT